MIKYLPLLLLSACVVETNVPPRQQIYDCYTYSYCDGYESYDEFAVCTNFDTALDIEDDFLYNCDLYGYYNCFYYECDAYCASTGLTCR